MRNNKTRLIIQNIEEGLENLKNRTDFNVLRQNDKVREIETALELYKKTENPDALVHLVDIFKKTGAAMMQGETSFDSTIWNANVQIGGKMTILEDSFWKLRDIVDKE